MKLAYFDNKTKDYLTRVAYPGNANGSMVNLDFVHLKGFEASLRYDTGKYYANLSGMLYTDTNVCRKGEAEKFYKLCYPGGAPYSYIQGHLPPKIS